jgi:hypothetical protein
VGREEKRTAVPIHNRPEMLEAVEADAREHLLGRPREQGPQFHHHQTEMLIRGTTEPPARRRRQAGEGLAEVREGNAAARGRESIADITQAPTDPRRGSGRQLTG